MVVKILRPKQNKTKIFQHYCCADEEFHSDCQMGYLQLVKTMECSERKKKDWLLLTSWNLGGILCSSSSVYSEAEMERHKIKDYKNISQPFNTTAGQLACFDQKCHHIIT